MRQYFKDYFTFSKGERNGIVFLVLLLLLIIVFPFVYNPLIPETKVDFTSFQNDIKEFESLAAASGSDYENQSFIPEASVIKQYELFEFDPNILSVEGWEKLGLSAKTVKTIVNFRNKGGKFYKKVDLQKIYGLKPADYTRLEPYILITPKTGNYSNREAYIPLVKKVFSVNINTADSAELTTLNGIGPAYAGRIVKFRNSLGGFVKKEQLMEVYGFKSETYDLVKAKINLDLSQVSKININTATIDVLKKHPYIKYNLAKVIVNYRSQHGDYKSIEEIKKTHLVNDELYLKLAPYLVL